VLTGSAASDTFAIAVSTAGDVDGDGYDDVVVGAPGYGSSAGRAYLYAGSASGLSSTASVTLEGTSESRLGYAVAGAAISTATASAT